MDRRQRKTREAIFAAFNGLLRSNRYADITVQQIIDTADIGRSTFYAHFGTKDDLLKAMCTDIFDHVFAEGLSSEESHDFSHNSSDLISRLTHVFHHLKDNEQNISGILSCDSGELFMRYFREYMVQLFSKLVNVTRVAAPPDYVLNQLAGSFADTVKWWFGSRTRYTPEETTLFYITLSGIDRMIH